MIGFPKRKPFRSEAYMDKVRQLPCCACDAEPPSAAHHIKGGNKGGMGIKPPDDETMPLCHVCHMELHLMGHRTWESIHGKQADHIKQTQKVCK